MIGGFLEEERKSKLVIDTNEIIEVENIKTFGLNYIKTKDKIYVLSDETYNNFIDFLKRNFNTGNNLFIIWE